MQVLHDCGAFVATCAAAAAAVLSTSDRSDEYNCNLTVTPTDHKANFK